MRLVRVALLCAIAIAVAARAAPAATVSLSVDSASIHAAMPFTLTLTAKGFAEHPAPPPPALAIDGCTVTYLGVSPSVSTRITITNGRRTEERDVTFQFRWRVLAPAAGTYRVPALEVAQGGVTARTEGANFEATTVPDTPDMIVRMRLPENGAYVGETFDASVDWLLARNAESFEFVVPLFDLPGAGVAAAPGGSGRTVGFAAGAGEVELPMESEDEEVNGRAYTRFRFAARVTLARAGSFELAPVRVLARLQTGETRDRLGFRRPQLRLYRAEGRPRTFTVRPLPVAGRPASFVNAIGAGFSLDVRASRTVVAVGDPIELTLRVRGDAPLAGLSLPPLVGPEGLPPEHFSVPEGNVTGRLDPETNTKTFAVTVRVTSAGAREIPPIAFSWFDPAAREYRTARSRPIALSVEAGEIVGAADVVAAGAPASTGAAGTDTGVATGAASAGAGKEAATADGAPAVGAPAGTAALIGADMSLSDPRETLARPWGTTGGVPVALALLYGLPALLAIAAWWLARSGSSRARRRTIRAACRELERALASNAAAREAAPPIASAVRRLADATGADRSGAAAALERLEMRAFDPAAANRQVEGDVADELRALAEGWVRDARRPGAPSPAGPGPARANAVAVAVTVTAVATAIAAGAAAVGSPVEARESPGPALGEARTRYAEALAESDRTRRVRLFADAERAFRAIAAANPDAGRVQVDWGNAALGAQDAGRAVLAYRRALRAMPDDARARANLAWIRGRMPAWLPRPLAGAGVLDSLLFWRGLLTASQLHLVAAGAFALGMLALAAGLLRGRGRLRVLAVPALAVWAIALASAWTARPPAADAVVLADDTALRSADSPGAAPALARPLPAGTEVSVLETRGSWTRIRLADGATGWLTAMALEPVTPNLR